MLRHRPIFHAQRLLQTTSVSGIRGSPWGWGSRRAVRGARAGLRPPVRTRRGVLAAVGPPGVLDVLRQRGRPCLSTCADGARDGGRARDRARGRLGRLERCHARGVTARMCGAPAVGGDGPEAPPCRAEDEGSATRPGRHRLRAKQRGIEARQGSATATPPRDAIWLSSAARPRPRGGKGRTAAEARQGKGGYRFMRCPRGRAPARGSRCP